MNEEKEAIVRHLYFVEGLSIRQIADKLGICRRRTSKILKGETMIKHYAKENIISLYKKLIDQWYHEYPHFKATQIYNKLLSYGYPGSYNTVKRYTKRYRQKKKTAYHELNFLPGEEAQIDWMVETKVSFGPVYGFVFILSYSRYLYAKFYPRQSFEFFLDGHIEAFREINGIPHCHRYDNCKSVVINRRPEIKYNAQFLDFARFYGFSIYLCNPRRANEKGRVERVIRDIRAFLNINTFDNLSDLNNKFSTWRTERNSTLHRTTNKIPLYALDEEKLRPLPKNQYRPYRTISASVSTTAFVSFDTNRYSVPTEYVGKSCQILAYPQQIEIIINAKRIATHQRAWTKNKKIETPTHRNKLLDNTPHFKYQRIYQLIKNMDHSCDYFLKNAKEDAQNPIEIAYQIFKLLKYHSKAMVISAIKQANSINTFKLTYIFSLLNLPEKQDDHPVFPQNKKLLTIDYQKRNLKDYDEFI